MRRSTRESTGTTDKRNINSDCMLCAFIQTAITRALPTAGRFEPYSLGATPPLGVRCNAHT